MQRTRTQLSNAEKNLMSLFHKQHYGLEDGTFPTDPEELKELEMNFKNASFENWEAAKRSI